jgi:GNAT superfamily N-acetyltransferase
MQLEGKALIGDGLKREAGVAPDGDLPLVLIARLATGEVVVYYNESLLPDLQRKLAASVGEIQFPQIDALLQALNAKALTTKTEHFTTYLFPADSTGGMDKDVIRCPRADPRLKALGMEGAAEHVFALERDGGLVSACASARENEHCGEARVFTLPEYRRHGLARRAVDAWARSLEATRKIPLYSHEAGDVACAALAQRLSLQPIFEEINILPASK